METRIVVPVFWLLINSGGLRKSLYGIGGRGPLLDVSRPRVLGEVACWKPFVSMPIKVFRADVWPMSHSKKCLPAGRRGGVDAVPVLGAAALFYPLGMFKSQKGENVQVQNITELFSLSDVEFVIEAYRNLLGREPDEHGLRYYLGRLARGYSRESVIAQLVDAPDAKHPEQIKGLPKLLKTHAWRKTWFGWIFSAVIGEPKSWMRMWLHQLSGIAFVLGQMRHAQEAGTRRLEDVSTQLVAIGERLDALQQYDNGRFLPSMPLAGSSVALSREDVIRAYRKILGRNPESETAIQECRRSSTIEELEQTLRRSTEYRSRTENLNTDARRAYHVLHASFLPSLLES